MPTVTVSIDIDAPRHRVFEIASDIPGAADRIRGITAIEMLSDGPVGPGTRWRETREMDMPLVGKKPATEEMWITEFDPPNRYAVEARSHGTHYLTPITCEAAPEGGTRLTMAMTGTPETLPAKIMAKALRGVTAMVEKCLREDLEDIKRACEQTPAEGSSDAGG